MKRRILITLITILLLLSSCDGRVHLPWNKYKTPTIKGAISLPKDTTIDYEDIFIAAIDNNGECAAIERVLYNSFFVIEGLKEDTEYSVIFTSFDPETFFDAPLDGALGITMNGIKAKKNEGNDLGLVSLTSLGSISGNAFIENEEYHYDVLVSIAGTSISALSGEDGSFTVYNVPEGTHTLQYTLDDYIPQTKDNVTLTKDEKNVKVGDVTMVCGLGGIEGSARVVGVDDKGGILIVLQSAETDETYTVTTMSDGSFSFSMIPPGVYTVTASKSGYHPMSIKNVVVELSTVTKLDNEIIIPANI